MIVAGDTPAIVCKTVAIQPVRSLPDLQWNNTGSEALAMSSNIVPIAARSTLLVTNRVYWASFVGVGGETSVP